MCTLITYATVLSFILVLVSSMATFGTQLLCKLGTLGESAVGVTVSMTGSSRLEMALV